MSQETSVLMLAGAEVVSLNQYVELLQSELSKRDKALAVAREGLRKIKERPFSLNNPSERYLAEKALAEIDEVMK